MTNQEIINELIGLVQTIVKESGDQVEFDARVWVEGWILRPNRALGGNRPIDYFDTPARLDRLKQMLKSTQSGTYI